MDSTWTTLTDADADRLIDAIDLANEFTIKLAIFRSGLIPPELRWLQSKAHEFYDDFSEQELKVFKMRCQKHTYPIIATELGISESSCKVYWSRSLKKIKRVIEKGI
jgi:DNA-binding NarL/FixJ family response regulator